VAHHDQQKSDPAAALGFWKSRVGVTLVLFFAVAALLLGFDHRIHIFTGNGLITALLLGCIVMHFFMHGGGSPGGKHGGNKS
jgi:hypothetical protein